MPYKYIAYDSDGLQQKGKLFVEQEETAERILQNQGLTIARLVETPNRIDLARWFPTFFGPKRRDVIVLTNQLANLIESGVGVLPALELMASETTSKSLKRVLRQVTEEIRQGTPISAAFSQYELVFPPIYHRMVNVGERTGNIAEVLRQLSTHMEKEHTTRSKIRGAMTYPAIVLALAFGVVLILLNFTLPPLLALYTEFNADLPWPTVFLMAASGFFLKYRLYLLIVLILLAGFLVWYLRTNRGKQQLHYLLLKMPVLGPINTQGNVARFSRTLATLLSAGLQLPESMELTRDTLQNVNLKAEIDHLRQETLQGRGISNPLGKSRFFPPMLAQVVRVGEETGTLDGQLLTTAQYYEEEVDRALKNLTAMLEPGMVIFVGLIVAFVAIAVIMPMYSLLGQIR